MPSLQSFLQLRSSTVTSPSGSQGPSPRSLVAQSLHSGPMSFTQDPSSSPSGFHLPSLIDVAHFGSSQNALQQGQFVPVFFFPLAPFPQPLVAAPHGFRALRQSRRRQSRNLRVRALPKPGGDSQGTFGFELFDHHGSAVREPSGSSSSEPRRRQSRNLQVRAPQETSATAVRELSSSSSLTTSAAAVREL